MKYKIDHPVFEDLEFDNDEHAIRLAERLVMHTLRNSDRNEFSIIILKWIDDTEIDSRAPSWFHHKTIEGMIGFNLENRY